jgi:pectate lyase
MHISDGKSSFMKPKATVICVSLLLALSVANATIPSQYAMQSTEWFRSEEGRRIADNVLTWQSPSGGWPKNRDTASRPYEGEKKELAGTFDNGATTGELQFLARAFRATGESRYQRAFQKGLDHIIDAQYSTGGWPQHYPPGKNYTRHITFNDDSMVRILEFLRDVYESSGYTFVESHRRVAAKTAFDKGIQCILDCQIVVNGKRTVWCAQHDEVNLRPRPARSYELESLSGGESASILKLLMSLNNPSPEIQLAIRSGAAWYESAKITGIRVEYQPETGRIAVEDPHSHPLWARFYEIETNRPFFCDRDGIKKYRFNDLKAERRNGYSWYGNWGNEVAEAYGAWKKKTMQ